MAALQNLKKKQKIKVRPNGGFKFSKVSALVHILHKVTIWKTFENLLPQDHEQSALLARSQTAFVEIP
jgi:hypothetical protein